MASKGKSEMGDEETMLKCFHCGKKAADRIVQTEGANKDRKYFKCSNPMKPECTKFFKWAEQLQVSLKYDKIIAFYEEINRMEQRGMLFYVCVKTSLSRRWSRRKGRTRAECSIIVEN